MSQTWKIDKQFSFCYGHRVWSQQLEEEFCAKGDSHCACRHLHGHEGLVHVFLEGDELTRGMVTDFKHLGWLKNFLDDNLDHKFIIDVNDPHFARIINGTTGTNGDNVAVLNTDDVGELRIVDVVIPGTDAVVGYELDVSGLEDSPAKEFYEGFFIVNFLPTSEHLSKWIYDCAAIKMNKLGVHVAQVDWFETPKSRSSFTGDADYVAELVKDVNYV